MTENELRILIVDDERAIRRFLRVALAAVPGAQISEAATGAEGIALAAAQRPDLVILDLGLPDIDGIEVTQRIREWSQVPVIILSVRDQESDKIAALDAGADDYLTKPFGVGELMARMRVVLRRMQSPASEPVYHFGSLSIDLAHRIVTVEGREIALTPTEYDLLRVLAQNAGKVLTHHHLLHQVWGQGYEDEPHLLRVNISNLRHKIETDPTQPQYILTELGVGYRLHAGPFTPPPGH